MTLVSAPSEFRTPRGRAASLYLRDGTADHNNVAACLNEDEYGLSAVELGPGDIALDIGAHIGGVTIALALDNPEAHVIAVEALSANVEMLTMNVALNDVGDRVTVIHGAAGKAGRKSATVRWNFDASESGQHHRFIGNAHGIKGGESESVTAWSLPDLDIAFAKIDCELCEYDVLANPNVSRIKRIVGEYHGGADRIVDLLSATHHVTTTGLETMGHFEAVLR